MVWGGVVVLGEAEVWGEVAVCGAEPDGPRLALRSGGGLPPLKAPTMIATTTMTTARMTSRRRQ